MRRSHKQNGFVSHELLMGTVVLAVLLAVSIGITKVLGLHGRHAMIPPGIAIAVCVAWVIGVNLVDYVRRKRRE